MHCLIDLTYIEENSIAGVFVYAYRLIKGLELQNGNNRFSLLAKESNLDLIKKQIPNSSYMVLSSNFDWLIDKIPHLNGIIYKREIVKIIETNKIDLFFSPFFSYKTYVVTNVPHVAVLHDAQTFTIKKEQKLKGFLFEVTMSFLIRRLTKLITISQYSKEQVKKVLPDLKCPIKVVHNSIEMFPSEKYPLLDSLKPYILNVNTLQPYKNLITLVKAFDKIKDRVSHTLVIKGKRLPYWDNVIWPFVVGSHLDNRVVLIEENISNGMLTSLYENADLFVSPSLMEGFGFTPIEAAICKTPVICTKEGALPETTMDLLNYYEPALDSNVLANEIEKKILKKKDLVECEKIAKKFKETYSVKEQGIRVLNILKNTTKKIDFN